MIYGLELVRIGESEYVEGFISRIIAGLDARSADAAGVGLGALILLIYIKFIYIIILIYNLILINYFYNIKFIERLVEYFKNLCNVVDIDNGFRF